MERETEVDKPRIEKAVREILAAMGEKPDRDGLTVEERLELCRNRCFIRTVKEDNDPWVYDDCWVEDAVSDRSWVSRGIARA